MKYWLGLILSVVAVSAPAQVVNVSKDFLKKSIVVTSFTGGANVSDVLKNDLRCRGWSRRRPSSCTVNMPSSL